MSVFGFFILFLTGLLWSWGAQISKKIDKFQGYHAKAFTFWGAYHRFNKFFLQVIDYPRAMQAMLAPIFFIVIVLLTDTWKEWSVILLGGISFVGFDFLKERAKKKPL